MSQVYIGNCIPISHNVLQMHCLIGLLTELTQKAFDDQVSLCANAGCFLLCILGSLMHLGLKDVPLNKVNGTWSKSVLGIKVHGVCLPSVCQALGSVPSTTNKHQTNKYKNQIK